jgi:hypothetical protein
MRLLAAKLFKLAAIKYNLAAVKSNDFGEYLIRDAVDLSGGNS